VEGKLSSILARVSDVEGRVGFLEDVQAQLVTDPPATEKETEEVRPSFNVLEYRSRLNNLRFVGIAEGKENRDCIAFPNKYLPVALGIHCLERGFEIDWAHRICTYRPCANERPRTIIARFLWFQDRERIHAAEREPPDERG